MDIITGIFEFFSGIEIETIARVATVVLTVAGTVLTAIALYAIRLLHCSARDSKAAVEAMEVDFSVLREELREAHRNQADILNICHEIRGGTQSRSGKVDLFMGTYSDDKE